MRQITVDIADLKISGDPESMLITYALGSCIAVMAYCPFRRVGGMIHYMLPLSKTNPQRALERPAMFADTGVPLLFEELYKRGCLKANLIVKIAGGGKLYEDNGLFDIGSRNYTMLRKMLWKNNVMIAGEDIGGAKSRTARLYVGDGRVVISSHGMESEL
jgi:chemotaxis protein CheD